MVGVGEMVGVGDGDGVGVCVCGIHTGAGEIDALLVLILLIEIGRLGVDEIDALLLTEIGLVGSGVDDGDGRFGLG